jgi:D-glycero-D-manno-heptose 1,7-bisphosphate phosphatase
VSATRRALFLDRDGVINIDHGYVHRPEQTEWVDGIFDLCRDARAVGYDLVVVTNQAGIARGFYSESDFSAYCDWLRGQFAARGCPLLAIYHCPHHPDAGIGELRCACDCRKPAPGMLFRARDEWEIDLAASALLGDQSSDILAARAAGVGRWLQLGATSPESGRIITMDDARRWLASANPGT